MHGFWVVFCYYLYFNEYYIYIFNDFDKLRDYLISFRNNKIKYKYTNSEIIIYKNNKIFINIEKSTPKAQHSSAQTPPPSPSKLTNTYKAHYTHFKFQMHNDRLTSSNLNN